MGSENSPAEEVASTTIHPERGADAAPKRPPRLAEFDVVRAVLLLGVYAMNYSVYFNIALLRESGWDALDAPSWLRTVFNTESGPLSTRFAATLAMLVGMGIGFGTQPVRAEPSTERSFEASWRLRRRGALFILVGIFFDAAWSGTILYFTGLYLVLATFAISWSKRKLLTAAALVCALTVVQRALVFRTADPENLSSSWWSGIDPSTFRRESVGTPRGFLTSVLNWGGHPILPWMAFVFVGMALSQLHWSRPTTTTRLLAIGATCLGVGYAITFVGTRTIGDRWSWLASIDPGAFRRPPPFGLGMPPFVIAACGSSIVFITAVAWLARRTAHCWLTRVLAKAGRATFSLYILHGMIPWVLFAQGWVGRSHGLVQSLLIALGAWVASMVVGFLWIHRFRIGPLEVLLRRFGG